MMLQRRYPGVRPFEAGDKDLFFGRDRDIRDLSILVALEKFVVLFGKSGYGKSSIINAGLIPAMTEHFYHEDTPLIPVLIRLGSYTPDSSLSPLENLLSRLSEVSPDFQEAFFLDPILPEKHLWYYFKKWQQGVSQRFMLIFDQFEEFFTYPTNQQDDFKVQLQEVLYSDMPQLVRDQLPKFDRSQRELIADPLDVKVLVAIRSDRLNLLHSMGDIFPAILDKRSRFELNGLSRVQAEEAIQKPAKQKGHFVAPAFGYSDGAIRAILDKLSESKSQHDSHEIEAFQLQILCEYLEGEIIKGNIPNKNIQMEHFIGKIDTIYEGYYQRLLDKLPASLEKAAQELIEESLIFEDIKSGEVRRLSVDADVLIQRYIGNGVTHATLRELENTFLLRREINSVGGYSYEVSHDTLLSAIISQKKLRKLEEESRLQITYEQENRKREYRQRLRLVGSSTLAILGFALAVLAWQKSIEADRQREAAEIARNEAQKAQKVAENALLQFEEEQKRSRAITFENTADNYLGLRKYEEALENYNKALQETPQNKLIQEKIEKCKHILKK